MIQSRLLSPLFYNLVFLLKFILENPVPHLITEGFLYGKEAAFSKLKTAAV